MTGTDRPSWGAGTNLVHWDRGGFFQAFRVQEPGPAKAFEAMSPDGKSGWKKKGGPSMKGDTLQAKGRRATRGSPRFAALRPTAWLMLQVACSFDAMNFPGQFQRCIAQIPRGRRCARARAREGGLDEVVGIRTIGIHVKFSFVLFHSVR